MKFCLLLLLLSLSLFMLLLLLLSLSLFMLLLLVKMWLWQYIKQGWQRFYRRSSSFLRPSSFLRLSALLKSSSFWGRLNIWGNFHFWPVIHFLCSHVMTWLQCKILVFYIFSKPSNISFDLTNWWTDKQSQTESEKQSLTLILLLIFEILVALLCCESLGGKYVSIIICPAWISQYEILVNIAHNTHII